MGRSINERLSAVIVRLDKFVANSTEQEQSEPWMEGSAILLGVYLHARLSQASDLEQSNVLAAFERLWGTLEE